MTLILLITGILNLKESFSLGKEAMDSLFDISTPPEVKEKIKSIIKAMKLQLDFTNLFWQGFGWERRQRYGGKGPGGFCVYSKCGYKIEDQRGVLCSISICPNCKLHLHRE